MLLRFKNEVEEELKDHLLPFWTSLPDKQFGSFYGVVNYDLSVDKFADKGGIATARLLWTFSAAYRVTKDDKLLLLADHTYDFLINNVLDKEYGGLYWMVDYKGNVTDDRKHVYATAFGIFALSEYYRVSANDEALQLAIDMFELIEEKGFNYDNGAYLEEFTREWVIAPNEMLSENGVIAEITTNTHLHVLEAYTNLYRVWPNDVLNKKLSTLLKVFRDKIFNGESKFNKVFFDKNWNEIINLQSYGHDIEASWLLDEAVKVLGIKDRKLNQVIIDLADNIADKALLEDGSLANECEDGHVDTNKIWWVQAEAVVGFLNAYEHSHDEKYIEMLIGLWNYIRDNIVDKRPGGEWHWAIDHNGPVKRDIVEPWKTPYHNVRFCLEVIERIK